MIMKATYQGYLQNEEVLRMLRLKGILLRRSLNNEFEDGVGDLQSH